jgi:hypothetical protein
VTSVHGTVREGSPTESAQSFSSPNNFRVFRLMKCTLEHAGQANASYWASSESRSSSSQCYTFMKVSGQVNRIAGIGL